MTLAALEALLEDNRGGVWFLPGNVDAEGASSRRRRRRASRSSTSTARTSRARSSCSTRSPRRCACPKHFGHNWDALEECLTDMDWVDADGYVIYYDHIDGLLAAHPDQFETLVEICRDAVASWKEDGTPIVVLFSGTKAPKGVSKLKEKAAED